MDTNVAELLRDAKDHGEIKTHFTVVVSLQPRPYLVFIIGEGCVFYCCPAFSSV